MKKWGVTLVGISLILVAVLIILGCVLVPRAQAKAKLREALDAFANEGALYVLYTDPHYKNEGLIAPDGRDLLLEGELLAAVREALAALGEDARYTGSKHDAIVGTDKRLLVKGAAGESVQLFFTAEQLYLTVEEQTYFFAADTAALLALLDGAI